jgi:hypothetical protein
MSETALALSFPLPVTQEGLMFFWRSDIERHKARLKGLPPPPADPSAFDMLVSAKQFAAELALSRRTVGRYVRLAQQARTPTGPPIEDALHHRRLRALGKARQVRAASRAAAE